VCLIELHSNYDFTNFVQQAFNELGLNFDRTSIHDLSDQARQLATVLRSAKQKTRMLIVLNEFNRVLKQEAFDIGWGTFLREATASIGNSRVIVTSSRDISNDFVNVHPFKLDKLSAVDGRELLRTWGLQDYPDTTLNNAVERAEGHPLALVFLAKLVVDQGSKLEELLKKEHLWQDDAAQNLLSAIYPSLTRPMRALLEYVSIFDQPDFHHNADAATVYGTLKATTGSFVGKTWTEEEVEQHAQELSRWSLLESASPPFRSHSIVRKYAYKMIKQPQQLHIGAAAYFRTKQAHHTRDRQPECATDVVYIVQETDHLFVAR